MIVNEISLVDGFGQPSILHQKGQESPRKPPRGPSPLHSTSGYNLKMDQQGTPGFARATIKKMRFFSTEIDGFGQPSILHQKGKVTSYFSGALLT